MPRRPEQLWDDTRIQSFLDIHKGGLEHDEVGARETLLDKLGLNEKEFSKTIGGIARGLREDVDSLLGGVEKISGRLKTLRKGDVSGMRDALDDKTADPLSDLSMWREQLMNELERQNKNPEGMLKKEESRAESMKRLDIEIALLLGALKSKHSEAVSNLLQKEMTGDVLKNCESVRDELYGLLNKRTRGRFNPAGVLDTFRKEIHAEKENRQFEELAGKVMDAFGKEKKSKRAKANQDVFLSDADVKKALGGKKEQRLMNWILKGLNERGEIAYLTDAEGNTIYMCRNEDRVKYTTKGLVENLHEDHFASVADFLVNALNEGAIVDLEYLQDEDIAAQLPYDIVLRILDAFKEIEDVKYTKTGGYTLPDGVDRPSHMSFFRAELAHQLGTEPQAKGKGDVESSEIYKSYWEERSVNQISLKLLDKSSVKFAHLTELLYGHKDADMDFVDRALSYLENLPPEERPDVIILSGLMFGEYMHVQKALRRVTARDKDGNVVDYPRQLAQAKKILDRCRAIGIKVIYNKSDEDERMIESKTWDVVCSIQQAKKGAEKADLIGVAINRDEREIPTSYHAFEKMQRGGTWMREYEFMWDVAFEYMVRKGRELYSRGEMMERFGVPIEEHFLLMELYDAHREKREVRPEVKNILDRMEEKGEKVLEDLSFLQDEKEQDLVITDNFNLTVQTRGGTHKLVERHTFRQSATSMVQNPLSAAVRISDQMVADGKEDAQLLMCENEEHAVGVLNGDTLIASTPGLRKFNRNTSSFGEVSSDKARRISSTRCERHMPGVTTIEVTDDGRYLINFLNEKLLGIADKTTERITIPIFSDWQTGSVTARADLAVKALDYILHERLPHTKMVMFFNGDMIQGWNYPKFPIENTGVGLVGVGRQQIFLTNILERMLNEVKHKGNIEQVTFTDGNHEWNSPHPRSSSIGLSHSLPLAMTFRNASEGKYNVKLCDYGLQHTNNGAYFMTTTAFEKVQGYGVLVQHILQERGGKGSGGGPPVYQARRLIEGVASFMPDVDVLVGGHYHHPNYLLYDNKLAMVNGSLAGLSGYEWWLGYNPTIGTILLHVGGGKAPQMEILTAKMLHGYEPQGAFAEKNLKGFSTDKGFDPFIHGYNKILCDGNEKSSGPKKRLPQSALQKALWYESERILWEPRNVAL